MDVGREIRPLIVVFVLQRCGERVLSRIRLQIAVRRDETAQLPDERDALLFRAIRNVNIIGAAFGRFYLRAPDRKGNDVRFRHGKIAVGRGRDRDVHRIGPRLRRDLPRRQRGARCHGHRAVVGIGRTAVGRARKAVCDVRAPVVARNDGRIFFRIRAVRPILCRDRNRRYGRGNGQCIFDVRIRIATPIITRFQYNADGILARIRHADDARIRICALCRDARIAAEYGNRHDIRIELRNGIAQRDLIRNADGRAALCRVLIGLLRDFLRGSTVGDHVADTAQGCGHGIDGALADLDCNFPGNTATAFDVVHRHIVVADVEFKAVLAAVLRPFLVRHARVADQFFVRSRIYVQRDRLATFAQEHITERKIRGVAGRFGRAVAHAAIIHRRRIIFQRKRIADADRRSILFVDRDIRRLCLLHGHGRFARIHRKFRVGIICYGDRRRICIRSVGRRRGEIVFQNHRTHLRGVEHLRAAAVEQTRD